LRDASAPIEACNFLEKQRELFATRRRKQADAIEFLHKYRADDELVLQKAAAARKSRGSQSYKFSARHNLTSGLSSPSSKSNQRKRPDARASVYSHAAYPAFISLKDDSVEAPDSTSEKSQPRLSPCNILSVDKKSICFRIALDRLKSIAREASRLPLPEDTNNDEKSDLTPTAAESSADVTQNESQCEERKQLGLNKDGHIFEQNRHGAFRRSEKEKEESLLCYNNRGRFEGEVTKNNRGDNANSDNYYSAEIVSDAIDCKDTISSPSSDDRSNSDDDVDVDVDVDLAVESNRSEAHPHSAGMKSHRNDHSNDVLKSGGEMSTEVGNNDDHIIRRMSCAQIRSNITTNGMLSQENEKEENEDHVPSKGSLQSSIGRPNVITAPAISKPCSATKVLSADGELDKEVKFLVTRDIIDRQREECLNNGDRLKKETEIDNTTKKLRPEDRKRSIETWAVKKPLDVETNVPRTKGRDSTADCEVSTKQSEAHSCATETARTTGDREANGVNHVDNAEGELHGRIKAKTTVLEQAISTEEERQTSGRNKTNTLDDISNTEGRGNGSEHIFSKSSNDPNSVTETDRASRPPPKRKKKKKGKSYYPASSFFAHRQFISR